MPDNDPLNRLVADVLQSAKYRFLCPDVIRRIGRAELEKRKSWKEALKETKNTLHQIAGAYLESVPPYAKWLGEPRRLFEAMPPEEQKNELRRMMLCHASTRERLQCLEEFYVKTLAPVRPVRSVLDIACGFNPLTLPWMGLEDGAAYQGCELFSDLAAFLSTFLSVLPYSIQIESRDAAAAPPQQKADVALVLKFLPVLEQTERSAALAWLQKLDARYLLVSFPTRTLGGRNVRMADQYEARFRELLETARWSAERFLFESELCFLIET